jgi:pimeloyl-ACP methyl ester carboxylesterase
VTDATARLSAVETNGAGPPVVLLHGFGGSAAVWHEVQPKLMRRAIALDLPGHAGSLHYSGFGSASFAARAVLAEMDQGGIGRFHLAGHSMGGAIAALIACRAPERVLSMTLFAPGGFGSEINGPLLRAYGEALSEEELLSCLQEMFAPDAMIPQDLLKAQAAERAIDGQTGALAHVASKILSGDGQGVLDKSQLAALAMPVSLLWGEHDNMIPHQQLWNAPSHFDRQLLAKRGHMLIDEAPDDVVAAILANIARAA